MPIVTPTIGSMTVRPATTTLGEPVEYAVWTKQLPSRAAATSPTKQTTVSQSANTKWNPDCRMV
jgi:hypothetical protein